jgi:ABC-2 type transport system permease protein
MTAEAFTPTAWWTYVRAALAFFRRDWAVFISYRTRMVSHLLSVAAMIATFHFTAQLVHVSMFRTPGAYFGFAVVGVVTMQVLTSTLTTPQASLRQELVAGTFERLVLSPFGPLMSVLSMSVFPIAFTLFTAIITLGFAGVVFGLPLHWSTVPLALPAALLGAISFMPFGIVIAAVTLAFKRAEGMTMYIVTGVSLIAGFYFPISLLPGWIRWTSSIQPFTPSVDLMRNLLLGTPLHQSATIEVAKLAGFAVALTPIACLLLHAAIQFGRRRGTIIEY